MELLGRNVKVGDPAGSGDWPPDPAGMPTQSARGLGQGVEALVDAAAEELADGPAHLVAAGAVELGAVRDRGAAVRAGHDLAARPQHDVLVDLGLLGEAHPVNDVDERERGRTL